MMPRYELSKDSKYYLPKETYLTVRHYCRQYPSWEAVLSTDPDTSRAITYDVPRVQTSGDSDPASEIAIKRAEIARKKKLVDDAVREAAPEIERFLKLGVCYGMSEWDLEGMGMPCGKDLYYDRMRKFYWILANRI